MSEQHADDPVRSATFDLDEAAGPPEVDIDIPFGSVTVELGDGPASAHVRHDPDTHLPWTESVTSILSWVGTRFGAAELAGTPAEAVAQSRIDHVRGESAPATSPASAPTERIVVRGPGALPLHAVPLGVTVRAPAGSAVRVRAAAGPITVTGTAGSLDLTTGSGDIRTGDADGTAHVRAGGGDVTAGALRGGVQVRGSGGEVDIAAVSATSSVSTGSGAVRIGTISGDVLVRTGGGDVTVAEGLSGSIDATTGSGTVRVGIGSGVAAEIDLSSASGHAGSNLDVADTTPDGDVPLSVRARTGAGDVHVCSAGLTAAH